ncbi:MAG TPA: hypothetical protein VJ278_03860, partial [Chthoniobacterales bacterium]|nr:hypothetical protein [Chthoniobacterales bacterium]
KVTADYSEKVNSGNEFTVGLIPSSRAQLGDSGREALKVRPRDPSVRADWHFRSGRQPVTSQTS